ncbi:unnamed protein product [Macrosiphum euphorbiae]|uniref:Uncharacterized protein n=1 Tax=Macrosiphum euphorbiae TaxID=13131 RepID=A0AAV0Y1S5_9HEMI|nr:unnamed protein product [Macrosiphum euphorbiae]
MTPYDETNELPTSTNDDQDMRSETLSPVFATSNYELGETYVFLNNLLDGFLWEYVNYYADKIIFKSDIMTWFYIYTSINLEQEKIHWVEGTGCMENYTTRNDRIIRKIKYNPILIDLRISNTICEFDLIRTNYFCDTYVEMAYILHFGYNMMTILNEEKDYIFTSYLNVEYLVAGSSINDSPIDIYFCISSNSRCRTVFSRENINKMQLSSRNKKNNVLVKDKKTLLDLLKYFKTCEVCGHRLQIWIGEQELGKIGNIVIEEFTPT